MKEVLFSYVEPQLTFQEITDDTFSSDIVIMGVLDIPVTDGTVELTTVGLKQLRTASDVTHLLNYRVKSGVTVTSATFIESTITITYTTGVATVTVADITSELSLDCDKYYYATNRADYESKAQGYELNTTIDPYGLVLCGSSSIEYWKTSAADMSPATTINVAIGGTTAEMWLDSLAQRLIYQYNPRGVVLYVGVNDMKYIVENKNTSASRENMATEVATTVSNLLDDIHLHLPNSVVYYVLVNQIPLARWNGQNDNWEGDIVAFNSAIQSFANGKDWLVLINAGQQLESDGHAISSYFKDDAIHMNDSGYSIWGKAIQQAVFQDETKRYN